MTHDQGLRERLREIYSLPIQHQMEAMALFIESSRNLAIAGAFAAAAKHLNDKSSLNGFLNDARERDAEEIIALTPANALAAQREHDDQLARDSARTVFIMFYAEIEKLVSPKRAYRGPKDFQKAIAGLRERNEQIEKETYAKGYQDGQMAAGS